MLRFKGTYLRVQSTPVGPNMPAQIVVAPRYIREGDDTILQWITASIPQGHQMKISVVSEDPTTDSATYEHVDESEMFGTPVVYLFTPLTLEMFDEHVDSFPTAHAYLRPNVETTEDLVETIYDSTIEEWWVETPS